MLDIRFYQKVHELKKELMAGAEMDAQKVFDIFEKYRSKEPIVYNIETTNRCNMRCEMCPRTTKMNIPLADLDMDVFKKIVDRIEKDHNRFWKKGRKEEENRS
jgi:uncharacterized radical SAM superfamily Fe-S cluster-containing enzyme